jgi:hypothetical protein
VKQSKTESVSEWIQRIQRLGLKFREATLQNCEQDERASILTLADKLRNICFVQGLYSDRIQTIVRSRNHSSFDDIAETTLEENQEFLRLKVDISEEDGLLFLIDKGADISLLKGNELIGATEYDPERKVNVKWVDGSPMETHGVLELGSYLATV